jgi:poly-gamma-glutamate synthesis protein (capsule biosynthesis protein)
MDLRAAGQPLIRNVQGLRLGILSYTEYEFGLAGPAQCGTHPIDPVHFVRTVERHRQSWDCFIVLLHAGNEYHPFPRPQLRELARFMCEQGAAAVVFQHSHCAGCWEEHAGGYIIHGQGNLLFDTRGAHACELNGFLVALQLDGTARPQLELVPYSQQTSGLGPQLLEGKEKEALLAGLGERSAAIQQPGFVEQQWDRFTQESPYNYLALVHGHRQRIRELDRRFGFLRHFYSRDRMRLLLHLIRCESHREAIITALGNALKQ